MVKKTKLLITLIIVYRSH